jgi:OmcA/MtrC family decaheme c-type cytochrome
VVCHNPGLAEADFAVMVHAIHAGEMREEDYILGGDNFSDVVFPQDLKDCAKCHKGTDGDNWKNLPTMAACGACHDGLDFASHMGGQTDNSKCLGCHGETGFAAVEKFHITDNATPNNPMVPDGAVNFTYEIADVSVGAANAPVVKFRIMADGSPVTFNTYTAEATIMLNGFTDRAPGFLVAWAVPQFNFDEPADYNNIGGDADGGGQPASVGLDDIWNGTMGLLNGPDGEGYYTATITAVPFPKGSTLRAVAMQGYYQQITPNWDSENPLSRHTIAAVSWVDGDQRRDIVDSNKCANCHEWFEGHGGNRVRTVQVCAVCHVPNLSSSGRTGDAVTSSEDPLDNPDDTNNLKDLIHGIHSAAFRETPYVFVRASSRGTTLYDWSDKLFPNEPNRCLTCHIDGKDTFFIDSIPENALFTNTRTLGEFDDTQTDVEENRASVPNREDLVNSPIASSCYYCHDGEKAVAHMEQNGGFIRHIRDDLINWPPRETCIVCHGQNKIADVELVHQDK